MLSRLPTDPAKPQRSLSVKINLQQSHYGTNIPPYTMHPLVSTLILHSIDLKQRAQYRGASLEGKSSTAVEEGMGKDDVLQQVKETLLDAND